jgi:tRNA-dihydrouridine synthase
MLSPLASITIPPFRRICAELGADITVSEMTSARGILYKHPKSLSRIKRSSHEKCFGIQLLTNDEKDLLDTIEYLENNKLCDFIELNLGCSKAKITNVGSGSALLMKSNEKKLDSLLEIGGSVSKLPFTLKIRAGYEKKRFIPVIKLAEHHNIAFITFHARLATDNYAQSAQKKYWEETKRETSIPLIANGDIRNRAQGETIIEQIGVDGVAIGRAARGNPCIFSRGKSIPMTEIYSQLIDYMKQNEYFSLSNIKIQSMDFLKRFRFAAKVRQKLMMMRNPVKIINETFQILNEIDNPSFRWENLS